jgi:DNA-binding NtrC family response regulator
MSKRSDVSNTMPLDVGGESARPTHERVSLVFYLRDGAEAVTLSRGDELVVGRSDGADLRLPDGSVSGVHARLSVLESGAVQVEDLDSRNGTLINGERVQRAQVRPGDQLALGAVIVGVHRLEPGSKRLKGLESHDKFLAQLANEVDRAQHYGASLAVILARAPSHVDELVAGVLGKLRKVDRAALYSDETLEILLPSFGTHEAEGFARELLEQTKELAVGVATFPRGGRNADELLARARDALVEDGPGIRSGDREAARAAAGAGEPLVLHEKMRKLYDTVTRASQSTIPVLVHGETGTGKELVARELHGRGPRASGELVCVNCGAIPGSLIESTLFGAEKGAFTGADAKKTGVFEVASGGTVFLDEIGELPAPAQAALLRVLENGRITRVGGTKEVDVDVRIVAATHRDLDEMVDEGTFRRDLLFRLNALTLDVPPLRERRSEIDALAMRFLEETGAGLEIGDDAREALLSYGWPGNVRELKNAIERAVVVASGSTIALDDFPARIRAGKKAPAKDPFPDTTESYEVEDERPWKERERAWQRSEFLRVLKETDGNQTEAAKRLVMPLRTFVHKLKTLGIKRKSGDYEVEE